MAATISVPLPRVPLGRKPPLRQVQDPSPPQCGEAAAGAWPGPSGGRRVGPYRPRVPGPGYQLGRPVATIPSRMHADSDLLRIRVETRGIGVDHPSPAALPLRFHRPPNSFGTCLAAQSGMSVVRFAALLIRPP